MQMEPELLRHGFSIDAEPVADTALFDQGDIKVGISSAEHFPAHLDITIGRDFRLRRHALFRQRHALCPTTQHVPVLDTRDALEFDELVFGLLGEPDMFDCHYAASLDGRYPVAMRVAPVLSS